MGQGQGPDLAIFHCMLTMVGDSWSSCLALIGFFSDCQENMGAIEAQIRHWYNPADPSSLHRGSAITVLYTSPLTSMPIVGTSHRLKSMTHVVQGKSTHNCRIEYIWRFVRHHVTQGFRDLFYELHRLRVFNPLSPTEMFYLQHVFLPVVQKALDDFRDMWNKHPIRGPRCSSVPRHAV